MKALRLIRIGAALAAAATMALGNGVAWSQAYPSGAGGQAPVNTPPGLSKSDPNDPNNPNNPMNRPRQDQPSTDKASGKTTAEQVADAQAQAKAVNLNCDLAKIRFIMEGEVKDPKDKTKKPLHVQIYETTCTGGLGYVIQGPKGGSADTFAASCVGIKRTDEMQKRKDNPVACKLPENLDLKAQAQAVATKAGLSCTVADARWAGMADHKDFLEVTCTEPSLGFLLVVSQVAGQQGVAHSCAIETKNCSLTPPAQQTAMLSQLAAKSGKTCDVTSWRYAGTDNNQISYIEVACAKGIGMMVKLAMNGDYKGAMDCVEAGSFAGGCTLTDKAVIQAASSKSFGDRLKSNNIACNVQQSRLLGQASGNRDVVEFQCSDRPAGLIVAFPNAGQKPEVVDCFNARHFGVKCEFVTHEAQMALLSKAMTGAGKTCTVSEFSNLGGYDDGTTAFELACGSAPGYIAFMPADYSKAKDPVTCTEAAKTAAKTGLSCSLPGNH